MNINGIKYSLKALDIDEYNEFLTTQDRYFYSNDGNFLKVNLKYGNDGELLGLYADNKLVIATKIIYSKFKKVFQIANISYGPIFKREDFKHLDSFFKLMEDYLRKNKKLVYINVAPLVRRNEYNDFELIKASDEGLLIEQIFKNSGYILQDGDFYTNSSLSTISNFYIKNIEGMTYKEVLASCNSSARNQMKTANKYGVKVRFLNEDEIDTIFVPIMKKTLKRLNLQGSIDFKYHKLAAKYYSECYFPASYIDCNETLESLNKDTKDLNLKMENFRAKLEENPENKKASNQIKELTNVYNANLKRIEMIDSIKEKYGNIVYLAATAFYKSPSDMIYLESASLEEYRELHAVSAIHSKMLEKAVEDKCKYYNFFGISGDNVKTASDYGVIQFKRSFQGEREELLGTYRKYLRYKFLK